MYPTQMIRLGVGDEGLQIPLIRLPYFGGQDSFSVPGGFYTTKDGEFGVAVDARLSVEELQSFATSELQKNGPAIAALLAAKKTSAARDSEAPAHADTQA